VLCSLNAYACSPSYQSSFHIEAVDNVEWSEHLYPPEIKKITVTRGKKPCYFGTIIIEVSLPNNSHYQISDIGFYFVQDTTNLLTSIFPDSPLFAQTSATGKHFIEFQWHDQKYSQKLNHPFYLVTVLKNSRISGMSKKSIIID